MPLCDNQSFCENEVDLSNAAFSRSSTVRRQEPVPISCSNDTLYCFSSQQAFAKHFMSAVVVRDPKAFCCSRCKKNFAALVKKQKKSLKAAYFLTKSMQAIVDNFSGEEEICDEEVY